MPPRRRAIASRDAYWSAILQLIINVVRVDADAHKEIVTGSLDSFRCEALACQEASTLPTHSIETLSTAELGIYIRFEGGHRSGDQGQRPQHEGGAVPTGYGDKRTRVQREPSFGIDGRSDSRNPSAFQVVIYRSMAGALALAGGQSAGSAIFPQYAVARIFVLAAVSILIGAGAGAVCDPVLNLLNRHRSKNF